MSSAIAIEDVNLIQVGLPISNIFTPLKFRNAWGTLMIFNVGKMSIFPIYIKFW